MPIPVDTFWVVFERVVNEKASARAIWELTDTKPELAFVNRIKAGRIVKWVEAHPVEARRAVDPAREIPSDFPATSDGVVIPKP